MIAEQIFNKVNSVYTMDRQKDLPAIKRLIENSPEGTPDLLLNATPRAIQLVIKYSRDEVEELAYKSDNAKFTVEDMNDIYHQGIYDVLCAIFDNEVD